MAERMPGGRLALASLNNNNGIVMFTQSLCWPDARKVETRSDKKSSLIRVCVDFRREPLEAVDNDFGDFPERGGGRAAEKHNTSRLPVRLFPDKEGRRRWKIC